MKYVTRPSTVSSGGGAWPAMTAAIVVPATTSTASTAIFRIHIR
jgi:hypothetical protein